MAAGLPTVPTTDETKRAEPQSATERAFRELQARTPRESARQRFLRPGRAARRRPESELAAIREGEQNRGIHAHPGRAAARQAETPARFSATCLGEARGNLRAGARNR